MDTSIADRIEKQITLRAPVERVWQALAESRQFGEWFGITFREGFAPGRSVVGEHRDSGAGHPLWLKVVAMEAPARFAYRWRPHAMNRPLEDENETTLVEFLLEPSESGTIVRIRESGFEAVPLSQRESNFRENDKGWDEQIGKLADYLTVVTDSIVKRVALKAPIARVWRAISDAGEFGAWFGLDTMGQPFEAGRAINAKITEPPEYAGTAFVITVVDVVAPRLFSFRWHPYAVEGGADSTAEPTTLVEFALEPDGPGTNLTVTESGFDAIPADRRATAFRSNAEGWAIQVEQVRKYLDG